MQTVYGLRCAAKNRGWDRRHRRNADHGVLRTPADPHMAYEVRPRPQLWMARLLHRRSAVMADLWHLDPLGARHHCQYLHVDPGRRVIGDESEVWITF